MKWTSKDLRSNLDTLKKMYRMEQFNDKKEEILEAIHTTMYNICDLELGEDSYASISDSMLLFNNVPKFTMYYPYVYEFNNRLRTSNYDVTSSVDVIGTKEEISRSDVFVLLNDFFKSLGKKVYNSYLEIDKDKDLCVNFDDEFDSTEGVTYYVPVLNKRYMVIGSFGDNRDILSTLTHEYGHSIATVMNPKRYYSDDFFTEIESLFFEMIGSDYYYNQTKDECFSLQLKDKVNNYFWNSANVLAMKRTSDKTFKYMTDAASADKLCHKYLRKEGFNEEELTIDVDDKIKYLMGYMVAVELFETYKEDKELAIDLLEKIVNRDRNISEYSSIVNTVTPNKNLIKHLERINRY